MITVQRILFVTLLLQIFALQKISFFGLPLYFLEFGIIGAIFFSAPFFLERKKSVFPEKIPIDSYVLIGSILFFFGAFSSTLFNDYSSTSLGQLKAWFLFPITYCVWAYIFLLQKNREFVYKAWYAGSLLITFVACCAYINGVITYDERLAFPYTSPNFLAYLSFPGAIIGSYFLSFFQKEKLLQFGALLSISVSAFVLYQTHSYNVWISTVVALIGSIFISSKNLSGYDFKKIPWKPIIAIIFTLSIVLLFETQNEKWQNLLSGNGRSALDSRITIWKVGILAIKENSFMGVGLGNFQSTYLAYQNQFPPYLEWAVPQPHNIFLAVWLQTGIMGLVGFCILITRVPILLYKSIQRASLETQKKEGTLLFTLWLFFLSYGILDTPYFRNDLAFLFWTQILLVMLYTNQMKRDEKSS